ncbi:unnamed protein product [Aphanomyces euteiches]|uniref:Major facilitator superfamily (MFS) profile domain-containing protein n=1 Tax=Aphanomyces euteiches TaxID=100861 RepID=A0A6G0WQ11_9STRA|nr:hypothetical protein Ae201684_012970 [Aphanomyces euteiches]KAH9097693.1 hypothetical protein Ae201684P_001169 [Aphanomyces euteiches]KAH9145248.1 hypothetical protein AeRB84_010831 [Aphanomyces euteiches]
MAGTHFTAPVVRFKELDDASFGSAHIRTMLVAGSGFLVDSYDNFVISLMVPMIAWEFFNQPSLPSTHADGWVKAASSWGNMIGQVGFAVLGDIFGRKRVYGYELMILTLGALLCALAVWPINGNPDNVLILLAIWRFILGIGVGGDYPVSAVITSEFSSSRRRGQYIATVFSMQGVGFLLGASVAVAVLAIFQDKIIQNGRTELGYCWRILAGFGSIPAMISVYFRLRIPETPRFTANILGDEEGGIRNAREFLGNTALDNVVEVKNVNVAETYRLAFRSYFSQWVNLKVLIGCAMCWFWLDIGYYGTNLNTSEVLKIIGYGSPNTTGNKRIFDDLWARATGTAIIYCCGLVPGYWFSIFFVERWGRKPIQYMGFAMLALLFMVMGIWINEFKTDYRTLFVVVYSLAQFFFNFGPNTTTFIIPAEVFPTSVRSTGHGISAASGKAGAIIAAQGFSVLANEKNFGLQGVLFIFSGCCVMGLLFSFWVPETKGMSLEEISGETFGDDDEDIAVLSYEPLKNPGEHNPYPGSIFSTKTSRWGGSQRHGNRTTEATGSVVSSNQSGQTGSQHYRGQQRTTSAHQGYQHDRPQGYHQGHQQPFHNSHVQGQQPGSNRRGLPSNQRF